MTEKISGPAVCPGGGMVTGQIDTYISSTTPQFQLDDLNFCQNAVSRSQRKLSEVRGKSGKTKVEINWPPCKWKPGFSMNRARD